MRRTLVLLTLALLAAPLGAQEAASAARRNVLSVNPIGIPAGFYSVDFERALGANVSGTLGASPITEGRVRGDMVTFTVDGVRYEGRVSGTTISGKAGGKAFTATRQH